MSQIELKPGKSYISRFSDLKVNIVKIHHQNDVYINARIIISNARNGIFYENKNIKLLKSQIAAKEWKLSS